MIFDVPDYPYNGKQYEPLLSTPEARFEKEPVWLGATVILEVALPIKAACGIAWGREQFMKKNDKLHGFILNRIRALPEQKAKLHEFTHEKSGAQLIWLERPEQNKTFCVSFRTVPEDDSGVFHILEHCVLGGSKKYDVKEPFAELLKNSVNTFLNAMTFSDKTVYPVASRNEKDFFNLMDVYLDGVFNPSVLENENIFRQEGWNYAFDEKGDPSYQGVVYNEMKGAASTLDRKAYREMCRLLFPDTSYRFDSGGDPAAILDLTYEDFKKAHGRFYHPSKALFFLDGQLALSRVLEKLDREYLQVFDRIETDAGIALQEPVGGLARHEYEIGPDEDPKDKCRLTLARLFASWEEVEKQLAVAILCDVLAGSNEAPLKKAILDLGLAQDFQMFMSGGSAQAWLGMEANNCSEDDFGRIKETLSQILTQLADQGLNKDDLLASLNQLYYQELDPQEPRGIALAIDSLSSWLYGGDPSLCLQLGRFFGSLREKIPTGYFEDLLEEFAPDGDSFVEVQSFPSTSYGRERDAREAARLEAETASWTPEYRRALQDRAARLEAWQASQDSPEALASLPGLTLEDLEEEPSYMATSVREIKGVTVLSHPSPAEGIVYLKLYFDSSDRPREDLAGLQFTSLLLGKLATRKREARSLVRDVKTHIGQLSFSLTPVADPDCLDRTKLYFVASCSVLESEVAPALDLIREILTETVFDDKAAIYAQLMQNREYLRQAVNRIAHYYCTLRVKGHFTAKDAGREALEGLSFILWIKEFQADFEEKWENWKALAEDFRDRTFDRDRLILSLTGNLDVAGLEDLVTSYPQLPGPPAGYASYAVPYPKEEGLVIPSAVSYACLACHTAPFGGEFSGHWMAFDQILSLEYLWNKIRVQGGAYGAGFSIDKSAACSFYSYRDPTPDKSLEIFRQSASFIRAFNEGRDSIERYLMGKLTALDPDLSFKRQADQADNWYLTGYTAEEALVIRQQLMGAKPEDLLPLAAILDQAVGEAAVCVAGPAEALAKIPDLSLIDLD